MEAFTEIPRGEIGHASCKRWSQPETEQGLQLHRVLGQPGWGNHGPGLRSGGGVRAGQGTVRPGRGGLESADRPLPERGGHRQPRRGARPSSVPPSIGNGERKPTGSQSGPTGPRNRTEEPRAPQNGNGQEDPTGHQQANPVPPEHREAAEAVHRATGEEDRRDPRPSGWGL